MNDETCCKMTSPTTANRVTSVHVAVIRHGNPYPLCGGARMRGWTVVDGPATCERCFRLRRD